MKEEKLKSLIDRLELFARSQPAAYRLRVGLLAVLGYAYLFVVVLLLLLVVFGMFSYVRVNYITLKVAWIPLVLIGVVLRSLWVTIPEPDGIELKREQAPRLFAVVEEVRKALNGPTAHHVLLSDEFNAGVVQIPRFGMFGWSKNYVVIGLPYLKALRPEEFRSVLAHEFGHLSGKHSRFSGWIYRLRQSWSEILERVHQERHYASFIFAPFLNWYAPFFNAYSFVLARRQEYEADGYSVDLVGKEVTARTLVRVTTRARAVSDEFWPNFYRGARNEAKPPNDPFAQMLTAVNLAVDRHKATKWAHQSLQTKTDYDDTHPALADRLAGLGYNVDELSDFAIPAALTYTDKLSETAADFYLNDLPEDFVERFDRLWKEQIAPTWHQQHDQTKMALARLEELESASKERDLTMDERWERVYLTGTTQSPDAALPLVREFLESNPDHALANLALGATLLEQKDATGISYLEKSLALDDSNTDEVCVLASEFHLERGEIAEGTAYEARARSYREKMRKYYERALNFKEVQFQPHGLSEAEVEKLQTQLHGVHGLGRTYLVREIIDDDPYPLYVMGAFATFTWHEGESAKHVGVLMDELTNKVELRNTIFVSMDHHGELVSRFEKIPNAVLVQGGDETARLLH